MKTKATAPVPQPGPIRKLVRKKAKKKFKKSKALGGSGTPGSRPATVASRPPKAPENFSQNWKALQELLKRKSEAPEKPRISQLDDKIHHQIIQKNRKKPQINQRETRGQKTTSPLGILLHLHLRRSGRHQYLPQMPLEQSRRKEPRRGHAVTSLLTKGTSSIRGKLRRQLSS